MPPVYTKIGNTHIWLSAIGAVVGGVVLFKEYIGGNEYRGAASLVGKTAIVTGANTGIGKFTAKEFARRGGRVIMACRDIKKCQFTRRKIILDTENRNVVCRECDLSSFQSVRDFAQKIIQEEERLDILVNNAGVMEPPRTLTKEGIELQLGVNHLGHFLLTNLLLDKLKASAPSRIVVVADVAHQKGHINFEDLNSDKSYSPVEAYRQSKLANMLFMRELANRLEGTKVTVNAVYPGIARTDISRHLSFYNSLFSNIILGPFNWLCLKSAKQGARQSIFASISEIIEGVSGKYYSNREEQEIVGEATDDQIAKRLWVVSEKWTRLKT